MILSLIFCPHKFLLPEVRELSSKKMQNKWEGCIDGADGLGALDFDDDILV